MIQLLNTPSQVAKMKKEASYDPYLASAMNELREILNVEMYVDVDKLRRAARHGIPSEIRGEVWKFLLGVEPADRSHELSNSKAKADEYAQLDKENSESTKRIRGEVTRYLKRLGNHEETASQFSVFENVIGAYLNGNKSVEYSPVLVHMCGPFVECLSEEWEIYYCFEQLIDIIADEYYEENEINECVAKFITLFRTLLPDLYNYFQDEEVDFNEWVASWNLNLLAKELPLDSLSRLWDTYFCEANFLELHVYVCLAILTYCKENLEDLEQSEIRTMLLRLPELDMDQILQQGFNLMHEIQEREISDGVNGSM
ncbi:RabGAP/TBC [Basidiobolus meristosporus CBS 931.73]|uniref:RabGAP/TBC n=1 Tax=Basidiobolus meristosporus CBS 931.73 TaxID=1314790 RepID=A0A1Y1XYB9_9FUNG|nr:RabGAP/TBC [Basidiobolus meristosporus CBS 931.73]|eukprot:ORX90747.1 RabGAP/TBC [Basidiobolus meristosporus CBS 931.73]